jgi:hypothetical protein
VTAVINLDEGDTAVIVRRDGSVSTFITHRGPNELYTGAEIVLVSVADKLVNDPRWVARFLVEHGVKLDAEALDVSPEEVERARREGKIN